MGPGFFPLDNRLGLLSGHFSPHLVQIIVRLGTLLPFEQVPALLAFLCGVHVSPDTVRRLTEQAGAAQVAIEDREVARLEREAPEVPAGAPQQQVSADGAMVPLLHGEWAEVRTVAIGTLDLADEAAGRHAQDITYFSRLCSAQAFIHQATLPWYTRGLARADTVVAVMDGADWLQTFIDTHCPDAVRILDFPHAVEYLAKAAQAAFGSGTREMSVWLDEWAPRLKRGEPSDVLQAIRNLPMPDDGAEEVRAQVLGYLTKRREQIAYQQFQEAGYPIGSGMVESANKLVVEARLKGSGMHWARRHVTPMLALRGIACSGTWETAWPVIWQELRRQEVERRRKRRDQRRVAKQSDRQEPAPVASASPAPPLPSSGDRRPAADHPWRRSYDPVRAARVAAKT